MTRTILQDFIDVQYKRAYKNKRAKKLHNMLSRMGEILDCDLVMGEDLLCLTYKEWKSDFTPITSELWHEYGLIIKGFKISEFDGKSRVWIMPLFKVQEGSLV